MTFNYKDYEESDLVKKKRAELEANSEYKASDTVRYAQNALNDHSLNKVADWTGGTYGAALQGAIAKINNREKFSYDLNADALYQQYKNQYINQGKLAMADAMGQASALTGGYGNSYAATVGNQAYQASLQNLNNIVPQLYQMAYDQYNQEGQDLYNQANLINNMYNQEYGQHRDQVADWNNKYNMLYDAYNAEANRDYSQFVDRRDYLTNAYNNAVKEDYGLYTDAYNRAFSNYQQGVKENQWSDEFLENQRQYDASLAEKKREYDANLLEEQRQYNKSYELKLKEAEAQMNTPLTKLYSDQEIMNMVKSNKSNDYNKVLTQPSQYTNVLNDINKMSKDTAKDYVKTQWANGNLTTAEYTKLYNMIRG